MMFSPSPRSLLFCLFVANTAHASAVPGAVSISTPNLSIPSIHNAVTLQKNSPAFPPFLYFTIGLQHILSQTGGNATQAANDSFSGKATHAPTHGLFTVQMKDTAQCGPGIPCADGSCCNSEGKCGYAPYNCGSTASTTCLSNCDARAMCGVNSQDGAQRCPLDLCCSYFGYCGATEAYCGNPNGPTSSTPCQQGFGSCQVPPTPSCDPSTKTATKGRNVAYYQAINVRYRQCNRIAPSQINTKGLTHLVFAFASIDPVSFQIVPAETDDLALYKQFTDLKTTTMQTWFSLGGFGFSDPGHTFTTWSVLCADPGNRATFISSLVAFMEKWGFQGVDIDWEYPVEPTRGGRPIDTGNLNTLIVEMRSAFSTRHGLSIALPPDFAYLQHFDVVFLTPYIDFFNLMTYDLHGPWEANVLGAFVRSGGSITDIGNDIEPLWFSDIPPYKINLGVADYGRSYTLSNASCNTLGCPYTGNGLPGPCTNSAGVYSLREIGKLTRRNGWTSQLDADTMTKRIYNGNQLITYDDKDTIKLKTQWADSKCLGGMFFWSTDLNSGAGSGDTTITTSTGARCGSDVDQDCTNSPFGDCCSQHGYCGNSPAYCLASNDCQVTYGSCQVEPPPVLDVSMDGSCGGTTTCKGSAFGDCCSSHGWCGSTESYCGLSNACQAGFGICV